MVNGSFLASKIRLVPASPGTGVIAGASVRAVLEMFGIQDCLTKCYGSTNAKNLVKATLDALSQLQLRSQIEALRGVDLGETEVEEAVRRGMAFMPQESASERAKAPVNTVGEDRRRGGRRGGGGGRRGGRDGGGAPAQAPAAAPPSTEASAPAEAAPKAEGGGESAG